MSKKINWAHPALIALAIIYASEAAQLWETHRSFAIVGSLMSAALIGSLIYLNMSMPRLAWLQKLGNNKFVRAFMFAYLAALVFVVSTVVAFASPDAQSFTLADLLCMLLLAGWLAGFTCFFGIMLWFLLIVEQFFPTVDNATSEAPDDNDRLVDRTIYPPDEI